MTAVEVGDREGTASERNNSEYDRKREHLPFCTLAARSKRHLRVTVGKISTGKRKRIGNEGVKWWEHLRVRRSIYLKG